MLAFDLGPVLAALSGVALVALGLLVLRVGIWEPPQVGFGAFATLWGAQLVAANLTRLATDPTLLTAAAYAFVTLLIPLYVPLAYTVAVYPWPPSRGDSRPFLLAALSIPAVFLLFAFAVRPSLLVEAAGIGPEGRFLRGGPLLNGLSSFNSVVAFAGALAVLYSRLLSTEGREEATDLSLVGAALAFYVSNRAALVLDAAVYRRDGFLEALGPVDYTIRLVGPLLALVVVLGILVSVVRRSDLEWRPLWLLALTFPFVLAAIGGYFRGLGQTSFDLVGLWRLASVGLFAYAITRYEVFGLEARVRDATPVAAYLVALGAGLTILWITLGSSLASTPGFGVTASLGVAACCWPTMNLTEAALDRWGPGVQDPGYQGRRKQKRYRRELEKARGQEWDRGIEKALARLRDELEISEAEHMARLGDLWEEARAKGAHASPDLPEKFEKRETIASGGEGKAWLARDSSLDRTVVLKEPIQRGIDEEALTAQIQEEAKLAAGVNHKNVVEIHEVVLDLDPPVLVLEHVEGGSLRDRLDRSEDLSVDEALDVLQGILSGLSAIHEEGIVHRDLKPSNVLLGGDDRAKITDFGVAGAPGEDGAAVPPSTGSGTDGDTDVDPQRRANRQPGTLRYMSPEQVQGEPPDARSDLYAAAAILYEALTGRHYIAEIADLPYPERVARVRDHEPDLDVPEIPDPLRDALAKGLAKDPESRFESAGEMRAALSRTRERMDEGRTGTT